MNKNKIIYYTAFLTYVVTIIIHSFLFNIEYGRDFLGFTMGIPLLIVFVYQRIYKKQPLLITLGMSRPTIKTLGFAMIFPIIMGLGLHLSMSLWGMHFLFQEPQELLSLLVIGLTISSISAMLEEIVWRGNFHYYLRQQHSLFKTALIIALIWSFWHLPIGLLYKGYDFWIVGLVGYLSVLFILSMILTYTRELGNSVVPPAILHGMFNVFYLSDGVQMSLRVELVEWVKLGLLVIAYIILSLLIRRTKSA